MCVVMIVWVDEVEMLAEDNFQAMDEFSVIARAWFCFGDEAADRLGFGCLGGAEVLVLAFSFEGEFAKAFAALI